MCGLLVITAEFREVLIDGDELLEVAAFLDGWDKS